MGGIVGNRHRPEYRIEEKELAAAIGINYEGTKDEKEEYMADRWSRAFNPLEDVVRIITSCETQVIVHKNSAGGDAR